MLEQLAAALAQAHKTGKFSLKVEKLEITGVEIGTETSGPPSVRLMDVTTEMQPLPADVPAPPVRVRAETPAAAASNGHGGKSLPAATTRKPAKAGK